MVNRTSTSSGLVNLTLILSQPLWSSVNVTVNDVQGTAYGELSPGVVSQLCHLRSSSD